MVTAHAETANITNPSKAIVLTVPIPLLHTKETWQDE